MKRKRVNGFVVGRRMRHGEPKWFVRVSQGSHPLNGQTLMASPGYGVAMVPSLEVDFYLGNAGDQPVATDVLPRGDKQQRDITMRNTILKWVAGAACAVLAIVALFAAVYKPWEWKEVKDQLLVLRVERAFDRMKGKAFAELIPDSVVEQAMKSPHVGTYSAREAALDEYLCMPVFGHKHSDRFGPKKDQAGQCYHSIYDAKSGDPDRRLTNDGLPAAIGMPIRSLRQGLFEVARAYLRDPDRLWSFYQLRKEAALRGFRAIEKEEDRERRVAELRAVKGIFISFYTSQDIRNAYRKRLGAERAWLEQVESENQDNGKAYAAMEEAEKTLRLAVPVDHYGVTYWTLYAGRRYAEGGEDLLRAYVRMIDDFLVSVT